MSVGQSNSLSQSGTYGTPNTSQLPPQQGTNDDTRQTQNSHSAQNGIANTSDPPSASMTEFIELSDDPEILALHDAIARGGQPNGGDETHPAGENANNVSRDQHTPTNLDHYLPQMSVEERQHWQEMWNSGDATASDFDQTGLVPSYQTGQGTSPLAVNGVEGSTQNGVPNIGSDNASHNLRVREVENYYSHPPSVPVTDLDFGSPSDELMDALARLSHYSEDETSNVAPGEGPTASSPADQNNIRSANADSPADQTAVQMSRLQLGTQTDDDSEGEDSGASGETTTPRRNRRGVRRVERLRRTTPEGTAAFFREFSDA